MKNELVKKHSLKASLAFVFCVAIGIVSAIASSAEVITVQTANAPADHVYVLGNDDLYPIEYYNKSTKSFEGVIPDMLAIVSERTGLDFAYVYADEKYDRAELVKNKQGEVVSAIGVDEFGDNVGSLVRVFKIEGDDGERSDIYVGFTSVARMSLREKIQNALLDITEAEKTSLMLKYSNDDRHVFREKLIIAIAASVLTAAIIFAVILFVHIRKAKKRRGETDLIDELTGAGNAKYYKQTFDNIMMGQLRDLYCVAFISWGASKRGDLWESDEEEKILKCVADTVNTRLAASDYLFRLEGGDFVLMYQFETDERATQRIDDTVKAISEKLSELDGKYDKLFTAGVCRVSEHPGIDSKGAISIAKQGYAYAAKNSVAYAFATKEVISRINREEKMRSDITRAIAAGEFKTFIQFIVDRENEKICGAEVLSRWDSAEYGMLTPGKYIEMMKQTGTVEAHDYYMFEELCKLLERWSGTELSELFLTGNFTRISVSKPEFADRIAEIASKYSFDHGKFVIEITEDSLTEDSRMTAENLEKCKANGFKIAIDDMGSGFSALSDLYMGDIDIVKLDRGMVVESVTEKGETLLRGVISLAHNMGAMVLCEGVETEEQRNRVCMSGCDLIQGFYYSRVLPVRDAEPFFVKNKASE